MKQRVTRLSPHQNGKVIGVLLAIASLIFLLPFFLFFSAVAPAGSNDRPAALFFVLAPLMYLVAGYLSVAAGCLLYNVLVKYLGGIEYEVTP
jgi:hypothetical protein